MLTKFENLQTPQILYRRKNFMTRLLTKKELCELLNVSPQTLYRWVDNCTFPAPINGRGRGKKLMWGEQQIEEWINRQSAPIQSPAVTSPSKQQQDKNRRLKAARASLENHRKEMKKATWQSNNRGQRLPSISKVVNKTLIERKTFMSKRQKLKESQQQQARRERREPATGFRSLVDAIQG